MDGRIVKVNQIPGFTIFDSRYAVFCDTGEIVNLLSGKIIKTRMMKTREGTSLSFSRDRLIQSAKEYRILQRQQQGLKTDEELEQMYSAVLREIQEETEGDFNDSQN